MSVEISPNVEYLIDQLKRKDQLNEVDVKIFYQNIQIDGQEQFDLSLTKDRPRIEINDPLKDYFKTLIFIDPDAPSSVEPVTGPFLHWILANFQSIDGSDGQTICEYRCPGPRPSSGRHRYIYLIYRSKDKFVDEKEFLTIEDRRRYRLKEIVEKNQLELISIKFFQIVA